MIDIFDKLPPYDLNAERGVLGCFALDTAGQFRPAIREILPTSVAFFSEDHQLIYTTLLELIDAGVPFDSTILVDRLKATGRWDEVGGKDTLIAILQAVLSPSHGPHYAAIVREHHRRRWVCEQTIRTAQAVWSPTSDPVQLAGRLKVSLSEFLRKATLSASRQGGAGELAAMIEATESGLRRSMPWPFPMLTRLTRSLGPGMISLLCGTPGDGKTFLVLRLMMHLLAEDVPTACFMLEGNRAYHLARCLAVMAGDSNLLDDEAIRTRLGWASSLRQEHTESLECIGRSIFDSTREECTLEALGRWVEREARHHRVLIIDPVTLAEAGTNRYVADEAFMRTVRDAITATGVSLILVTHPKTRPGSEGPKTLDDLAGGAVYTRAAETVLLLRKHQEPKPYRLIDRHGAEFHTKANRELRILKARNGPGGGQRLALDFSGGRLAFEELGLIRAEEKEDANV